MLNSVLKSFDFKTAAQHHAHLHLDDVQALTWLKKHFKRKLILSSTVLDIYERDTEN